MKSRALPILYILVLCSAGVFVVLKGKAKKDHGGAGQEGTAPASAASSRIVAGRVVMDPLPASLAGIFSGQNAWNHVKTLCDLGPRPPQSAGYQAALAYAEKHLAAHGWKTRRQTFQANTQLGPLTFTNLLARHGSAAPDWNASTSTLIGGHLDTKLYHDFHFTGANDSGSSTGVILEMARVLATDPKAAASVELVLFDGEEALGTGITPTDGLYGSKYYARELSARRAWPSLGVVLDLVGDDRFQYFFNPEASPATATAVMKAASQHGMNLSVSADTIIDDHIPLQNAGLSCLHLIGDFQSMPYWHQPGDTLENVTPRALEKAGRVTLTALASPLP